MLNEIDLSLSLSKGAFKHIFSFQRQHLYDLEKRAFDAKLPTIIVFEGWDAAGKGTSIRQLTSRLDPRGFKVYAIHAPGGDEMKMPWLWRFWMKIPRRGQMAIFDRSWYGRVLVERVRQLTPIPDWIRAYEEINEFERTLADDGIIFVKFWLHVTRQEQLRRFIMLTNDPERAWQVTAEDWGNHRQFDSYLAAVNDMLANTDTAYASWTVVQATDQYYTIYTVFKTVITALEQALDLTPTHWLDLPDLEVEAAEAKRAKEARKLGKKQAKEAAAEPLAVASAGAPSVDGESSSPVNVEVISEAAEV